MSARGGRRLTVFIAHPSELLTDHLPHGDGLVSFGFIKRLAMRGHEIHVAAQRVAVREAFPPNLHVYEILPNSDKSAIDRLTFMVRMRALFHRLSRQIAFDVVHQMNPVFTGLSLCLIGVRQPIVLGTFVPRWNSEADVEAEPGATPPTRSWWTSVKDGMVGTIAAWQQTHASGLLLASPDAITRIAPSLRQSNKIFEVPHGIDISRFTERAAVPARPSVLFLANVIRRKGIFTLLESFDAVTRAVPGVELVIAGGGGDLEEVRRVAERMPQCAIRILGHTDRAAVPALMREHSVYCLPSYGEPFATSLLEAMASGLPVVATRAGGTPYLITDEGGRLVSPREAGELAAALIEVLRSPELQQTMGRHNRRRIVNEFEAEKVIDRLERVYESVVQARWDSTAPAPRASEGRS